MSKILKAFKSESTASNAFRGAFWYLIIDREPRFSYAMREIRDDEKASYERHKTEYLYYSTRKPFISTFVHSLGTKDAFGGAKITLPLTNGESKEFRGDLWSASQWLLNDNVFGVGISTRRALKKCYVFHSSYIDKDILGKWLDENPDKIETYGTGKL